MHIVYVRLHIFSIIGIIVVAGGLKLLGIIVKAGFLNSIFLFRMVYKFIIYNTFRQHRKRKLFDVFFFIRCIVFRDSYLRDSRNIPTSTFFG